MSEFWQTLIANLLGGVLALAGALLAVRFELGRARATEWGIRQDQREEEALLILDDQLAGLQLRIARSFGESEVWVPPVRDFPELETFTLSNDDPQNPIDLEGIREAFHALERTWRERLAARIYVEAVRVRYQKLREDAFLFSRPDVADVRLLASQMMRTIAKLRVVVADALSRTPAERRPR